MQAIYFDMDGTIANLYGVEEWEPKLRDGDPSPYREALPLVDMSELCAICQDFIAKGITIGIISWLAMNSSKEYDAKVREAKREWLAAHFPVAHELHFVKYGTTKKKCAKIKDAVLVDDNAKVRAGWSGDTIDANEDILKILKKLLASC